MSYFYATVTREKALEKALFGSAIPSNAYSYIESFMQLRSIPGSKKDLVNGDRVYRIHANDVVRLDLDRLGRRFIPTRLGNFFFEQVDQVQGKAVKDHAWLPVGP